MTFYTQSAILGHGNYVKVDKSIWRMIVNTETEAVWLVKIE